MTKCTVEATYDIRSNVKTVNFQAVTIVLKEINTEVKYNIIRYFLWFAVLTRK